MKARKEVSKQSLILLKVFLRETFSSGWDIELLYFLKKNEKESWTSDQLVEHFQVNQSQIEISLMILRDKGLIRENTKSQNYRYFAETSEKNALVELLVKMFENKKLQLFRIIYE